MSWQVAAACSTVIGLAYMAIFWTILYRRAQVGSDIPEFVYVNF